MTAKQVDFDDPELWERAKEYLRSIGGLPLFLTSTVRAVRNARIVFQSESSPQFKEAISQTIRRLLLSPSYKAAFFEAAREYYPERLSTFETVSGKEVTEVFSADEVSAVIMNYYLFRRLNTLTSDEDFGPLYPRIRTAIALGHLVGQLIDTIGPGNGMVIASSQVFALGILCKKSPQAFRDYRRKMRPRKELFNQALEVEYFHTTAHHVAASLIQACGYGTSAAVGMYCPQLSKRETDDTVRLWAQARRVFEVLQLRGASVTREELGQVEVVDWAQLTQLLEQVGASLQNLEASNWLFVGKQDGLDLLESSKKQKEVDIEPEAEVTS